MNKDKLFKIKADINWRKEGGVFMLLDPEEKRLCFFNKSISDSVSNEGIININKDNNDLVKSFLKRKIIQEIDSSKISRDFKNRDFSSPLNITLQITDNCNLKCIYCHRDSKNTDTIDFSKLRRIISDFRSLNVFNINISGGEPLLVPEIVEIVKTINNSGMKVTMSSNCTLLTAGLARKLKEAGLSQIQTSIDSKNPETHNRLRGFKNAFEKAVKNTSFLKKENIPFAIVTTLVDQSPKEYEEIIDFSYKLGAFAHKTNTFVPTPNANIKNISDLRSFKSIGKFIDIWKKKKEKYDGKMLLSAETMFAIQMGKDYISPPNNLSIFDCGCPAGFLTCAINQKGNVLPCPFFPGLVLGNIFDDTFKNIWNNKITKQFRNRNAIDLCGKCKYKLNCGGCRARSFGIFNKLNQRDPYCFKYR